MANAFTKPEKLSATALSLLQRLIVVPATMTQMGIADFRGAKDDTVKVPVRARLNSREVALRATGGARNITTDDLVESSVTVALAKNIYSSVDVTDEETTLDVDSFAARVLAPQVRGVAEGLEAYAVGILQDADYAVSVEWAVGGDLFKDITKVRRILNRANVPDEGRIILISPELEEALLTDEKIRAGINPTGLGEGALRDAAVGRLGRFEFVVSNALAADEAYAYHRSAFVFANVAPSVPQSVVRGHSLADNGFALRWTADYNSANLTERSTIASYVGGASIEDGTGAAAGKNVRAVAITVTGLES